jgi:hypothetical protein
MKFLDADQTNITYISKSIPFSRKYNFMSKERKESTIFLGWMAAILLLIAAFNCFILKPIIRGQMDVVIEPINTKLIEIQDSVTNLDAKISDHIATHGEHTNKE